MKFDLLKRNEGRPQSSKFLRLFTLLAMLVVGIGASWAQTSLGKVEIGSTVTANNSSWLNFGNKGVIKEAWIKGTAEIKNPAGYYVKITESGKIKLRFTHNDVHPGDILKVNVGPSGDNSENLGYTVEGSNTFVEAGQKTGDSKYTMAQDVEYILKSKDIQDDPDSDYDMIVINRSGGGYAYAYHSFEIVRPDGYSVTFSGLYGGGTVTAKRNDLNSEILSGWTVPNGTSVTFTAVPSGDNLAWKWTIGSEEKFTSDPQTITINNNINVTHQFGSVWVYAYSNDGNLGDVVITHNGQDASQWHVAPFAGNFDVKAKPKGHGIFEGWYSTASRNPEDKLAGKGETFTVSNPDGTNNYYAKFIEGKIVDVNVEPAGLNPDIKIYQHGHHEGCSAGNNGDWGTLANHKPVGTGTNIDVTVGDVDGYTFDGWYINGVKQNDKPQSDYNYGNVNADLTLVAKFKKNINITSKPDCGIGHYFDQTKLNAGNGATLSINEGKGTVTTGAVGGYVSFNFTEGYNITDIYKWAVGSSNKDNVEYVAFCKGGNIIPRDGGTMIFNRDATNRVLEETYKQYLSSVDEIRIGFKANTTTTIDYFTIELKPDVMYKVPTLAAPTTTEMVIYDSDPLNLRITDTNGYWREYTDANYNETTFVRIGKDVSSGDEEWKPSYDLNGLTPGDYYFGIRHGGYCKLGHYHTTELVKVHVKVNPTPTNLTVTYNLNASGVTGSAPVDNKTYNYKDNAVVMAPGAISMDEYIFDYWSLNPDGSGTRYSNDSDKGSTTIQLKEQNTTLYAIWTKKGFGGYFSYENRLIAQWNFDLCDGARFHEASASSELWDKSTVYDPNGDVKTTYTLKEAIGSTTKMGDIDEPIGGELVYATSGEAANVKIPIAAGLKFTAEANKIKIRVTKNSSGVITNTQLILEEGVKMEIPYVRNSFRNDQGNTTLPSWGHSAFNTAVGKWEDYENGFDADVFGDFQDCIHHVNRDIVYMVSNPTIWDGAITNKCYDDDTKDLFNSGGDEAVHGLPAGVEKKWYKYNFLGNQGTKCILTFSQETIIDRIGVNRNLVYSFYTENLSVASDGKFEKPYPGLRLVGSPKGSKIADIGGTYATYGNAIAMTYGGWAHNNGIYKDGNGETKTDNWGGLTVYHGNGREGDNNYGADFSGLKVAEVPIATDGFPVYSSLENHAYSEVVNPANNTIWHDANQGMYQFADNSSIKAMADKQNFTPWTLPCRGAYVKFEPTYPGVLNVHILQEGNVGNVESGAKNYYYIADEFGHIVKDNVYTKTGSGASNPVTCTTDGYFYIKQTDNVKYSFDVYPGKTYYLFSNTAKMGVTGFYFEPYVYRKYNSLSDVPDTKTVNTGLTSQRTITLTDRDKAEEYELARQDVGIKTATMSAGPNFDFMVTSDVRDYTNQTVAYPGGDEISWKTKQGVDQWGNPRTEFDLDASGNKQQNKADLAHWDAISKSTVADYPTRTATNVNPLQYDNKAVHVTLNRSFTADRWSTIVLPYSMNNLQLETVFGEGTKVVLLRDVQDRSKSPNGMTTVSFVYHENQDIIAGYPYLILPAQDVSSVETNAFLDGSLLGDDTGVTKSKYMNNLTSSWKAPEIFTISGEGPNLVTYNGTNYGGMSDYVWVAGYDDATEDMPEGSYVMSNNNLVRINNGVSMKNGAFKGYLKYTGNPALAKDRMIQAFNLGDEDDEATAIEDVLFDAGIISHKTNVYSVNGMLIRENTDDLRGLERGIYIVNGKKYIVR